MFESARIGIAVALALETLLLLGWLLTRWRERRRVSPWWLFVGPMVAALAVVLDVAVETNREHVTRVMEELVLAVEQEDAVAVGAAISEDFLLDNGLDKAGALAVMSRQLATPVVESNMINELVVEYVDERGGRVKLKVTTLLDPEGPYGLYRVLQTTWRMDFLRDADGHYRLRRMEMLELNGDEPIDVFKLRPF